MRIRISSLNTQELYDEVAFLCEYLKHQTISVNGYFGWNHQQNIEWTTLKIGSNNLFNKIKCHPEAVDLKLNEGNDPELIFTNDADIFIKTLDKKTINLFLQPLSNKTYTFQHALKGWV